MAANLPCRGLVGLGKRFVNQIRLGNSCDPTNYSSLALRRAVHASVYDKEVEDQVRPTVVPDDVIKPASDKYWAPDPQTGVFGPATKNKPAEGGEVAATSGGEDSVLEQKAFFRPLEGLEKPEESESHP